MSAPLDPTAYEPKAALRNAARAGAFAGGLGFVISAVQNALSKHSYGAMGVFTRTGSTIAFLAASGATFALTDAVVANTRQKDDPKNGVAAGCAVGFLAGVRAGSIPVAIGACAFLGAVVGTYDYAGGGLTSITPKMQERQQAIFKKTPKQQVEAS